MTTSAPFTPPEQVRQTQHGDRSVWFRGIRRDGLATTGHVEITDLARWVQDRFNRGWRSLTVFDGDHVVARIERKNGSGERVWWADDDTPPTRGPPDRRSADARGGRPMTTLTWVETEPGRVWRSVDGRYAIVAHTLPENPPRTVYQARKIDEAMARAYPSRGDLGYLVAESPSCWNSENNVHSAEAECERHAYMVANWKPGEGVELVTTTDRQEPCDGCGVKVGQPHKVKCSFARCLVTGEQRLLCTYFGGSPVAGVEAVAAGSQDEFEAYFKTPTGHDCGQDIWQGKGAR